MISINALLKPMITTNFLKKITAENELIGIIKFLNYQETHSKIPFKKLIQKLIQKPGGLHIQKPGTRSKTHSKTRIVGLPSGGLLFEFSCHVDRSLNCSSQCQVRGCHIVPCKPHSLACLP